jgi:hypothetical protein
VNGKIDYGKFMTQIEKKGVDFKNPDHFNTLKAKETSSPMLTSLIEAKESITKLSSISQQKKPMINIKKQTVSRGR